MQNVFHFCLTVIPMMFSLSVFNVITDSMLTKSVPSSDTGEADLHFPRYFRHKVMTLSLEPALILCRHHAGVVCVRPVSASHSWANCWWLPVCDVWRFFHRNNPVCHQYCGVCVLAAASLQQDAPTNGVKSSCKTFFHTLKEEAGISVQALEQSFLQLYLFKGLVYSKGQVIPEFLQRSLIRAGSSGLNH